MSEVILNPATTRSRTYTRINLGDRKRGHPWAMFFVIAPNGNFLITGDSQKVNGYIKERWPFCLYRYTFWGKGRTRGGWRSIGFCLLEKDRQPQKFADVEEHRIRRNQETFPGQPKSVRFRLSANYDVLKGGAFYYRRLPHKWLPEWDSLCLPKNLKQRW